jgi:hypothetical protein
LHVAAEQHTLLLSELVNGKQTVVDIVGRALQLEAVRVSPRYERAVLSGVQVPALNPVSVGPLAESAEETSFSLLVKQPIHKF